MGMKSIYKPKVFLNQRNLVSYSYCFFGAVITAV